MKKIKSLAALASMTMLASCSTIIQGSTDPVSITTIPNDSNTTCNLKNGRGEWSVAGSGTTEVKKSKTDLLVNCKNTGGASGSKTVESDVDAWYFGNVVFGGLIGLAIVDPISGSMWKYPSEVTVNLMGSQASAQSLHTPSLPGTRSAQ